MSNENKTFSEWIKENENRWLSAGIIAGCIAVVMPFIIYFASNSSLSVESIGELGPVGDFLGGTTVSFLSLASILFLISTIVMQRKELGMQREELQMTREELIKANEQYEITNNTMLKQQFETTFFNMINMHNSLVDGLTLYNKDVKGKDVFIMLYESINGEHYNVTYEKFLGDLIKKNKDDFINLCISYSECLIGYNELAATNYELISPQEFHDTFFPFTNKLTYRDDMGSLVSLRNKFQLSYHSMVHLVGKVDNIIVNSFDVQFIQGIKYKAASYDKIMSEYFYPLTTYFKSINTILNFVATSNLNLEEKKRYLTIFTSVFNSTEITLLHYESQLGYDSKLQCNIEDVYGFWYEHGLTNSIL